ncbi:MAG: phage tail protein [Nostoc sp.]
MTQAIQKSKGTKLYLALLPTGVRAKPVDQTLVAAGVSSAAIAKAATSIPIEDALTGLIPKGQWLLFKDESGVERLAQLSADAVVGATTLAVFALPEAIADGSTAEFPVRIQARSGASVARSANLQSSITFDSGSERDGTTTSRERGLSAAGNYLYYDAGLRTAEYAYENDQEVWVKRILPPPSDAYSLGKLTEGPAAITSIPDEVPADGFVSQNLEVAFLGYCNEVQPKPKT